MQKKVAVKVTPNWTINVCKDWARILQPQFEMPYFKKMIEELNEMRSMGTVMYPKKHQIFRAFEVTDFDDVKVVIVGQDPYPHSAASGLAFGVNKGMARPRTLINICDELERELNSSLEDGQEPIRLSGLETSLVGWADQGVLLLNSVLTSEQSVAGAHQGMGWERLTDAVVHALKHRSKPLVYMLWGLSAQEKIKKVVMDQGSGIPSNILVLQSTHPSPLSYNRGPLDERFQGCEHFLKANQFLKEKNQEPIKWEKTGG